MQLGLWETVDHIKLMRPMRVDVLLQGGATGLTCTQWRKRFVFQLSLLGLTYTEADGRLVIRPLHGDEVGLKRRTRVLDWLLAQEDVLEVQCAWPRPGEEYFSIRVVETLSQDARPGQRTSKTRESGLPWAAPAWNRRQGRTEPAE